MNGEQAERFEELLVEACEHFIEGGGTIASGQFTSGTNSQCPMTCLFGRVDIGTMVEEASSMLGTTVSGKEIWAFIYAFDGKQLDDLQRNFYLPYVSAKFVGKNLRAKYVKE
jgi:hypothetical protein